MTNNQPVAKKVFHKICNKCSSVGIKPTEWPVKAITQKELVNMIIKNLK